MPDGGMNDGSTGVEGAAAAEPTASNDVPIPQPGVPFFAKTDPGQEKTSKDLARDLLVEAGLSTPPKSTGMTRRNLVVISVTILVILVVLVIGSLVALSQLSKQVTTTTTTTTVPPPAVSMPATAPTNLAWRGPHGQLTVWSGSATTRSSRGLGEP
jgi:hypothetical protein